MIESHRKRVEGAAARRGTSRGPLAAILAVIAVLSAVAPPRDGSAAAEPRREAPASPRGVEPPSAPQPSLGAPERLADVRSWGYQLQHARPAEIAASGYDLVVIDYTRNGDPERPLSRAEVQRMKKKPGGGRRIVLAYVSVGEAEDYRFYWNESWIETATAPEPAAPSPAPAAPPPAGGAPPPAGGTVAGGALAPAAGEAAKPDRWIAPSAPAWLGDESERWGGNFAVKYWDPAWHDIIYAGPRSFLARVQELGFDGVYLDRVDAYYEHIDQHPSAAEDMVTLVTRLADTARQSKPGFLVVPQNGEELLTRPAYVAAIDAIAKEDLFYGSPDEGRPNAPAQIANSLGWLSHATTAGRRVLVVEYLDQPADIAAAHTAIVERSYVPYFGPRGLDSLSPLEEPATTRRTDRR